MRLCEKDPIFKCWRMSAIHRCVLRKDMSKEWALARIREIHPDGSHDSIADNWFIDIDQVRQFSRCGSIRAREAISGALAA